MSRGVGRNFFGGVWGGGGVVLNVNLCTDLCPNTLGLYTGYTGWRITAAIPVKFGTAHGRLRPEVGSTKRIETYGSRGVSRPLLIIGIS